MKKSKNRLTDRQKAFLRVYGRHYWSITDTAKAIDVPRRTVYNWLQSCPAFVKARKRLMDEIADFAKERLIEHIQNGSVRATIFFLKTYAKNRGFNDDDDNDSSNPWIS